MTRQLLLMALLAASSLGVAATAHAQEPQTPQAPQAPQVPQPPGPPSDQARGYTEPPSSVEGEDVALFLPRAILFLPRMVVKLVFFPLGETLAYADRHAVIERIEDVLYNDARTAAIVPVLSLDTFFGASIGAKAFHNDLAGHGERGSIDARFGGKYEQAYQIAFRADRAGGTHAWVESLVRYEAEGALLFQGIGDAAARDGVATPGPGLGPRDGNVETRFRQQRLMSLFRLGYTFGDPGALAKIGATGSLSHREFGAGVVTGDQVSIGEVYDTSRIVGFERGVDVAEITGNVVVDTRDVNGATSSGAYIEAFGGGVPPMGDFGFWHYGLELTGYFDLYKKTRVFVLRGALEGTEGTHKDVPFSELPRLGGPNRLRGYPEDRFRDAKAAVGTVEYHYPIHQYIAGSIFADVGSVAPAYGEFFGDSKWRLGAGGGFIIRSQKSVLITLDIAYGDGLQVYATTDPLRAFTARDTEL